MCGNQTTDGECATVVVGAVDIGHRRRGVECCRSSINGILKVTSSDQIGDHRLIIDWVHIDGGGDKSARNRPHSSQIVQTSISHHDGEGAVTIRWVVRQIVVCHAIQQSLEAGQCRVRGTVWLNGKHIRRAVIADLETTGHNGVGSVRRQREAGAANGDHLTVAIQDTAKREVHGRKVGIICVRHGGTRGHGRGHVCAVGHFRPGHGVVHTGSASIEIYHWKVIRWRNRQSASGDRIGVQCRRTASQRIVITVIDHQTISSREFSLIHGWVVRGTAEHQCIDDIADIVLRRGGIEGERQGLTNACIGCVSRCDGGPGAAVTDLNIRSAKLHGIERMRDASRQLNQIPGDILGKGHTNIAPPHTG